MKLVFSLLLACCVYGAPQEVQDPKDPQEVVKGKEDILAGDDNTQNTSVVGSAASVEALASEFEDVVRDSNLPIVVPDGTVVSTEEKFGTVNIFGIDVPIIILAKIGLAVIKVAKGLTSGNSTAAVAAALASGIQFPEAGNREAVAEILAQTAGTAAAIFKGDVKGEVYFAQAKHPNGIEGATVVTAKFSGLSAGTYRLEVRSSGNIEDKCSNVGGLFTTSEITDLGVLGRLVVDDKGLASTILSRAGISLSGDHSILGRSIALVAVPDESSVTAPADASSNKPNATTTSTPDVPPAASVAAAKPVACAIIVRQ
ncbi:uncharacterized protein LOC108676513 [Hyalella azteca]|uniref:Uncharacterized protein LOC108676513 n=1 Tax=Hyalella azteca TaxID=294128 RepID=A0A8B7P231_HYAAZ|nr:uncharacterized protein LOC108676513 [Hyalella azteca]